MKKLLLLAIVISGLMTSCKKDRTCECSITETFTPKSGSGSSGTGTVTTTYTKASKNVSGVRDCVSFEQTDVDQDGDKFVTKGDCKLK
jgi:hypothetical protein